MTWTKANRLTVDAQPSMRNRHSSNKTIDQTPRSEPEIISLRLARSRMQGQPPPDVWDDAKTVLLPISDDEVPYLPGGIGTPAPHAPVENVEGPALINPVITYPSINSQHTSLNPQHPQHPSNHPPRNYNQHSQSPQAATITAHSPTTVTIHSLSPSYTQNTQTSTPQAPMAMPQAPMAMPQAPMAMPQAPNRNSQTQGRERIFAEPPPIRVATEEVSIESPEDPKRRRRKRLLLVISLVVAAVWLFVLRPKIQPTTSSPPAQSRVLSVHQIAAEGPTIRKPIIKAIKEASILRATGALAAGRYDVAAAEYQALARQNKKYTVYQTIANILYQNLIRQCNRTNREETIACK